LVDVERRLIDREDTRPALTSVPGTGEGDDLSQLVAASGLKRVQLVAWRDLEDPEAGGSELHAHRIAARWAEAGLKVTVRTSAVPGQAEVVRRQGYTAVRRYGRYGVFPAVMWEGLRTPALHGDGLVEIWNGMPFLSPLWFNGPRIVFLHHVHAEMWRMTLPGWLAYAGETIERLLAPPLYRRTRIVTLSESSRQEIVGMLGIPEAKVSVAPPGVGSRFRPGGSRSAVPLVVAVGRLVPVKRHDLLIRSLAEARRRCPTLEAVIIGEGYERPRLEELRRQLGAEEWLSLPGHLGDEEVIDWYRRAWVVASASKREGWGMTLTEAAACGTPAVATRIAGHLDAVADGMSGMLPEGPEDLGPALVQVLTDAGLRQRLAQGALEHARRFTWEATARQTLEALAAQVPRSGLRFRRRLRRGR
jgi:glycosyltransferase involved in cell wall biosynthesis